MEFLDDAVSKTREVIETVSQKTGEVIAVEKQKYELASIKAKREKDFNALGKLYYKAVKDDENAPQEVKSIVEEIKAKSAQIKRLNESIQEARNKRVCKYCGASIDKNSVFCNICGAKLEDGE